MNATQQEAISGMKVLVRVAMADGVLKEQERLALAEAMEGVPLSAEVSIETLLVEENSLEELLSEISSPAVRTAVYQSAYAVAHIDGQAGHEEQVMLEKIRETFALDPLDRQVAADSVDLVREGTPATTAPEVPTPMVPETLTAQTGTPLETTAIAPEVIEPVSTPVPISAENRAATIDSLIRRRAVASALLGAFPIPGVSLILDVIIVGLQSTMVLEIARLYGFDPQAAQTRQLRDLVIGNLGLIGATIAVRNLAKFVPVLGSAVGAAGAYATTWAAGKIARRYFESGGTIDMSALRNEFKMAKKEGEAEYRQNADAIRQRQEAIKPELETLSEDFKAGRISKEEYQRRVQELTESAAG